MPTPFQHKIGLLDAALTATPDYVCIAEAFRRGVTPEHVFGREYHLNDGGYSRVVASVSDDCHLFLTGNSTDRVRARWAACADLAEAVRLEVVRWADEPFTKPEGGNHAG